MPSRRPVAELAFDPGQHHHWPQTWPVPDSNPPFLFQALKRQSLLGLSFFNSILAHGDLRNNRLNQLSVNLWHLAQRHGYADTRTMVRLKGAPTPLGPGGCGELPEPPGQSIAGAAQHRGQESKSPASPPRGARSQISAGSFPCSTKYNNIESLFPLNKNYTY